MFHRAIAESGAFLSKGMPSSRRGETLRDGKELGVKISRQLGCDGESGELAALRSKTPQELLEALEKTGSGLFGHASIGPVVDGYVLPERPQDIFAAGKHHEVPLLIGKLLDALRRHRGSQRGARSPIGRVFRRIMTSTRNWERWSPPVPPSTRRPTAWS